MIPGSSVVTNRIASIGVTACGIILAAVPLALWIAWTRVGFLIVLVVAVASVVLLGVLLPRLPSGNDQPQIGHDDEMRTVLPNEFVEEIHKISPLTYHHSGIEKVRFRRAMNRLRRMIR